MATFFNLCGYTAPDPLDKAPGNKATVLTMAVSLVLTVLLLFIIVNNGIVQFNGFSFLHHYFSNYVMMALEVVISVLVFAPLLVMLRKSSSIVALLIPFIPFFIMELFIQSHYRCDGCDLAKALWFYPDPSILSGIKIPLLKFSLTIFIEGIILGILSLYVSRLIAAVLYKKIDYPIAPTKEQFENLFKKEWTDETIAKPHRDAAFYIFRILGFIYVTYLMILFLGIFGASVWPLSIRSLIEMTYANHALAINTYFKISLMIMLAFTSAYNKSLRYYSCIGLITGHTVSTIYSLIFYLTQTPDSPHHDFHLASALADGGMIIFFLYAAIKFKKDAAPFAPENDFPINFSVPMTMMKYLYSAFGFIFLFVAIGILSIRLFSSGTAGLGAVYGYPEPMVGNTLTLYITLSVLSFLLVKRERLRQHLFNAINIPLVFGGIVALLWFIFGSIFSNIQIETRFHTYVQVDWYFILHAVFGFTLAAAMVGVRKMYYKVDYAINTLTPSAAINIIALENAFFGGDDKQHSSVLKSIDQFVGGIPGRKRGLLNLPFGLLENSLVFIYGIHPPFSSMSRDEQRYFLSKYFFRNEMQRKHAGVPALAEFAYQIGMSLNALITFSNYSYINSRNKIGYVPVDARDRLQNDFAAYPPPFKNIAPLPNGPTDAANFKINPPADYKIVAPRVTTPVKEDEIPAEVDYLIVGSGAGAATAAYRLACSVKDPSKILMVERGNRYQPLQDFSDNEMDMMKKVYKEGGLQSTKQFTMTLLQGECVGGTTVINNAVCFEMPDKVNADWKNNYDIDLSQLNDKYKLVAGELNIEHLSENGVNTLVADKFKKAVEAYNKTLSPQEQLITADHYPLNVNHLNNVGDGNWNLGNKRMRKRSMLETYIPWAESRGVKVISNLTAVRFVTAGNKRKASHVILRAENGALTKVKVNKAVIVAGGVVASSNFLTRSEVPNANIGKRLSCNFAFPIAFDFKDELRAFDGDQITLGALDPEGRSAFETYYNPPGAFALSSVPFYFDKRDQVMSRYNYMLNFGSLLGSEPNGVIEQKPDLINGQAFSWELGTTDRSRIKYGLSTLIKLGELAGSTKAILPFKPGIDLALTPSNIAAFNKYLNDYPLRMQDLYMGTAHPQGGNMMTGKNSSFAKQRVVNENFQVDGYENVFVADASLFPVSITVNPQWTIMAMSSLASESILKICE